jgi:N-acetylmuramoyl-L-alanine amidase
MLLHNTNSTKKKMCLFVALYFLTACSTVPYQPPQQSFAPQPIVPHEIIPRPTAPLRHEVCHIVAPLETVWRISKMYDVSVESIIRENRLNQKGDISKGQQLIIKNAAPWQPVIALFKTNKWKYIIIHHSATDFGSALSFDKAHLNRGFWHGLGYHFVIDNGTDGKADGQIEVSPRWIKQQDGAHCKASNMNTKAIGVCVVGNYSTDKLSSAQMDSLTYLVKKLQDYYKIPRRNIMGHGQVPGANTECPGKNFPWNEFWRRLG